MQLDMLRNIKEKYEKDGFAVIENFFTEEECNELKKEFQNLVNDMPSEEKRTIFSTTNAQAKQSKETYFVESANNISYFFENDAVGENGELLVAPEHALNKVGHALHELNPVFKKYTFDERVKETLFQLGYQEPAICQSMCIFKNPKVGSEVITHQDATYIYTDPVSVIGFWFAIEDATIENGCLWVSSGSHKSGVHRRYIRNPNKNSDELIIYNSPMPHYQKSCFSPVPVKKGSCILIHGQVVHYSEHNKSLNSRHAYTFHAVETKNTKWSSENWIQLPQGKTFMSVYKN